MNGKRTTAIVLPEETYKKFKTKAEREGFGSVAGLVRHLAVSALNEDDLDTNGGKNIKVYLDNYDEVETYVKQKKMGKVGVFAAYAMEQHMNRYPLSEAQKKRLEKSIE